MKLTTIIVFCLLYCMSQAEIKPALVRAQINKDCLTENKFTMEEFVSFATNLNLPLSNPNYALYLDCLYKRQGWIVDGKINYSDIKVIISNGIGEAGANFVVDACSDLPPGTSDVETVLNFGKCLAEQTKGNEKYYKIWINRNLGFG